MQDNSFKGTMSTIIDRIRKLSQKRPERYYTLSEVSDHCHCNDCWIVIGDNVYDVTSFLDKHPGGFDVLMEHAGRDATVAFYGVGHLPNTLELFAPFCVGTLAHHERVNLIGTVSSNHDKAMWPKERVKMAVAE